MNMQKILLHIFVLITCIYSALVQAATTTAVADLLIWHVSQETESTWASVASISGNHTTKIYAPNVQFDWDPGFRVGFIREDSNQVWDSSFIYTYFQAKTNATISNNLQVVFPEFFSGFASGNFFFGGALTWRLQMNMFDYDFGRKVNLSPDITIRPAIGLKGGTIYQHINSTWNALAYTSTEKLENNFVGLGPSFRLDSSWHLLKNLNLFGNFATAWMWGNWQISDVYSRPAVSGIVTATTISTELHNTQLGTMVFDYCLGLELDSKSKPGLKIQVGYQMQLWVNQLRIPTFQILPVHGDLTLQGGTCRVIISF